MRHVAVLAHEIEECREELVVLKRRHRDIAEHADALVPLRQPPHDLHAAEQQQVVDYAQQVRPLGGRQEFRRHDDATVGAAQPGEAFVETCAALRQVHDGLQVQVDTVLAQRILHGVEDGRAIRRRLGNGGRLHPHAVEFGLHALGEALDRGLKVTHLLRGGLALGGELGFQLGADLGRPVLGLREAARELPDFLLEIEDVLLAHRTAGARGGHVQLDERERTRCPDDRRRDGVEPLVQVQRNCTDRRRRNVNERQHDVGDNRHCNRSSPSGCGRVRPHPWFCLHPRRMTSEERSNAAPHPAAARSATGPILRAASTCSAFTGAWPCSCA